LGDVAKILPISTPLTSQHVKTLVHAHLVKKQRVGKHIYLSLDRRGHGVSSLLRAVHPSLKKPASLQKPL
jgi:DNA-binding transcriptional ArsR family regulator